MYTGLPKVILRLKTGFSLHICETITLSEDPAGAVQPASWGWAVVKSGGLLFTGMVLRAGHSHLGLPAAQQPPPSLFQESCSALPSGTQESQFIARQTWELAKKVSVCSHQLNGNIKLYISMINFLRSIHYIQWILGGWRNSLQSLISTTSAGRNYQWTLSSLAFIQKGHASVLLS